MFSEMAVKNRAAAEARSYMPMATKVKRLRLGFNGCVLFGCLQGPERRLAGSERTQADEEKPRQDHEDDAEGGPDEAPVRFSPGRAVPVL